MYNSDEIKAMREKILSDPEALKAIGNSLKESMTSNHISLCSSVLLSDLIIKYYSLPNNYFKDTWLLDFQDLVYAILAALV